ncbi:MAG: hypothetical protein V1913_01705 [Fibrobacterota bacterium]
MEKNAGRTGRCAALLSLLAAFFLCGCAAEKKIILPVDARFANLSYDGYVNESGITQLENWPADTAQSRILLENFNNISASLQAELKKYARKGRYNFVERRDLASLVVQLYFLPYEFKDNALTLPVELRVTDLRSGLTIKRAFVGYAEQPRKKAGPVLDNNYYFHLYGVLLGQAWRSFPGWQIAQLFYPHEENSY